MNLDLNAENHGDIFSIFIFPSEKLNFKSLSDPPQATLTHETHDRHKLFTKQAN